MSQITENLRYSIIFPARFSAALCADWWPISERQRATLNPQKSKLLVSVPNSWEFTVVYNLSCPAVSSSLCAIRKEEEDWEEVKRGEVPGRSTSDIPTLRSLTHRPNTLSSAGQPQHWPRREEIGVRGWPCTTSTLVSRVSGHVWDNQTLKNCIKGYPHKLTWNSSKWKLGHSNMITCLTSFFWKKNPVRLQKKKKKK